jgi:hypothetical protein
MKKNLIYLLTIILIPTAMFMGCAEDDGPQAPDLSITVDPLLTESEPGSTIEYSITVAGDLKAVTLNNTELKTFDEGTFNDTFTYEYTFPAEADADAQLTFSVVDRKNNSVNAITQVSYIRPDYALADFSNKIADEAMWGDWWEGDGINPIAGATYDGGDASPSMYVTSRGGFADDNWDFAADLPDGGTGLMMTRLSIRQDDGTAAWDGYMIPALGWYGEGMTQPSSEELDLVKVGQRVIAIDVYYKTDSESPKSFSDLSVAGKGVKFQWRMGNLAKFKATSDKGGWFIAKEAFVAEPNKWITLYFDTNDEGEISNLTMDGTSEEVNFAWLIPAFGQADWDSHKIFLKNLRITNAE